jgi:hypothetical protein
MKLTIYKFETDEVNNIAYPVLYCVSDSPALSDRYYESAAFEIDLPEGTVINEGQKDSVTLSDERDVYRVSWIATIRVPGDEVLFVEKAIERYSLD